MIFGGTAGEIMNRFAPANVRAFFEEFAPGSALSVPCLTSTLALCHSALIETSASGFNLRATPQGAEGQLLLSGVT